MITHTQDESISVQSLILMSYFFADHEAVWSSISLFAGYVLVLINPLALMVLCAAGVQVLQYEEEFRQLFVLTLSKLKGVSCSLLS